MSLPSIVSYGSVAKTSSLVWDGDLVIPDGYAIESANGKVGIVGDVSISGAINAENGLGVMKGTKTQYFVLNNITLNAVNTPQHSSGFTYGKPYAFTPTSDITLSYSDGDRSKGDFFLFTSPSSYMKISCKNNNTATYNLSSLPAVITGIATTDGASTQGTLTMTFSGVGIRAPINTSY